jgi:hypothetical protein
MSELPTSINGIMQYVTDCGCWNRDGYGTQQRQSEIARLIHYLLPERYRYRRFLEIGSAAGGTARLLDDFFHFNSIHIIDDNELGFQDLRKDNLPNAVEWVGDSTSTECLMALESWGMQFDLIHIDAGHKYECVSSDTTLAAMFARNGAVLFLHDVVCCEGIARWVAELRSTETPLPSLRYLATFADTLGIGVFRWM